MATVLHFLYSVQHSSDIFMCLDGTYKVKEITKLMTFMRSGIWSRSKCLRRLQQEPPNPWLSQLKGQSTTK